jgi:hypothetical protein
MQPDEFRTVLIPAVEVLPDGTKRDVTVRTQWFSDNIIDEVFHRAPADQSTPAAARKFVQAEGKYGFVEQGA